jgi:hypothetical protein
MKKVYAVGALKVDLSENPRNFIKDQRLWYLFDNFEQAEHCVLNNQSDIFECYYNLALIEEISVIGDSSEPWSIPKQWWYKYEPSFESGTEDVITAIPPPSCAENVACFWVG